MSLRRTCRGNPKHVEKQQYQEMLEWGWPAEVTHIAGRSKRSRFVAPEQVQDFPIHRPCIILLKILHNMPRAMQVRCVRQNVRDSACHGGVGVGYYHLWERSTSERRPPLERAYFYTSLSSFANSKPSCVNRSSTLVWVFANNYELTFGRPPLILMKNLMANSKEVVCSLERNPCAKTTVLFSETTPTNKRSFTSYLPHGRQQTVRKRHFSGLVDVG